MYASWGFEVVYFGQVVLDEVKRRGLELNHENERTVRESLRADFGMAVIAERSVPAITTHLSEGKSVVIDGIYSMVEVETLRLRFGETLSLLAVHCPTRERLVRARGRAQRPLSEDDLVKRDAHELDYLDKARPIVLADEHVLNDGTVRTLRRRLRTATGWMQT